MTLSHEKIKKKKIEFKQKIEIYAQILPAELQFYIGNEEVEEETRLKREIRQLRIQREKMEMQIEFCSLNYVMLKLFSMPNSDSDWYS